jgi:hypothetical protein
MVFKQTKQIMNNLWKFTSKISFLYKLLTFLEIPSKASHMDHHPEFSKDKTIHRKLQQNGPVNTINGDC